MSITIASLFTGAGGLDLGFKKAGFDIVWANEKDRTIWETFEYNFPNTKLDKRNIVTVPVSNIPSVDGIIGGPPCQSWSQAGAGRGIKDKRGELFFEYIRILKSKQPAFFLAENVYGILAQKHLESFTTIVKQFEEAGYYITYKLLNAHDYGVPQDRKRLIIVGYHKHKVGFPFEFPKTLKNKLTLRDSIWDLRTTKPFPTANRTAYNFIKIPNHEYLIAGFSSRYMSCNRVRAWDEPSYTIVASGEQVPFHPQAPKMIVVGKQRRALVKGKEILYRRFSVRECARIQTFPDTFIFKYTNINNGYKMVGNAVPVQFAFQIAKTIYSDLKRLNSHSNNCSKCK
jgi:DNA (cytosine-5)-methyltransferase 1